MLPLNSTHRILQFSIALCGVAGSVLAESDAPVEVIASVSEQKMAIVRDGAWMKKYRISTSRFGLGDSFGSYKTPVGRMRVCEKLGDSLPAGAVIKHRQATGEVLEVNAPGRDPIVSRILWLEGLEAQNEHARARSIYIHGTPEESRIGRPVSWGCIRMRSEDVVELFDMVPVGTVVTIFNEDLPRLPKWKPEPPPVMLAKQITPAPRVPKSGPAPPPRLGSSHRVTGMPSPVAQVLRPDDARPVPADPGAATALRGSILFAGLSEPQKRAAKTPTQKQTAANPPVERAPTSFTPFVLTATPPSAPEFSLASTLAMSPLQAVDLRRLMVEPESNWASLLEPPRGPDRLAWLTPEIEQRLLRTLRMSPSVTPASF